MSWTAVEALSWSDIDQSSHPDPPYHRSEPIPNRSMWAVYDTAVEAWTRSPDGRRPQSTREPMRSSHGASSEPSHGLLVVWTFRALALAGRCGYGRRSR